MKLSFSFSALLILLLTSCEPAPSTPTPTVAAVDTREPPVAPTATEVAGMPVSTPNMVATVVSSSQGTILETSMSPDGVWQAEVILYECVQVSEVEAYAYERLSLTRIDTGTERSIDSQLRACGGLGAFGLGRLFWSSTGQYLYYTPAREGMPDGLCGYWERPLIRMHVDSGEVERLSLGPISPDGTMMAMSGGDVLILWSIDHGEMARIPVAIADAWTRGIAWSPTGHALVYLQTESDCYPVGESYLIHIELPDLEQRLLFESEAPTFGGLAWHAPDRIRLFNHEDGSEWELNLVTGRLSPLE